MFQKLFMKFSINVSQLSLNLQPLLHGIETRNFIRSYPDDGELFSAWFHRDISTTTRVIGLRVRSTGKKTYQSHAAITFFDTIFKSDFECQLATAGKRFFWSHKKQSWLVHWSKQPLVRVPVLNLQLLSRDEPIL